MIETFFSPDGIRDRLVSIPGARNLREMGGYPTRDGRRVRRGMLYRGGHPGDVTAEHLEGFERLGLRAILDLRTTEERAEHPWSERLRAMLEYWAREYSLSAGEILRILRDPSARADIMRDRMLDSYRRFHQEHQESISALFRLLQDGRVPLMINCTAGKDRTGVVCAILLTALGVEEEVVRRDYALTEELHPPSLPLFNGGADSPYAFMAGVDPDVWRTLMRSEPAYIDATFATLHETYGTVEEYLQAVHGVGSSELKILRNSLLED